METNKEKPPAPASKRQQLLEELRREIAEQEKQPSLGELIRQQQQRIQEIKQEYDL